MLSLSVSSTASSRVVAQLSFKEVQAMLAGMEAVPVKVQIVATSSFSFLLSFFFLHTVRARVKRVGGGGPGRIPCQFLFKRANEIEGFDVRRDVSVVELAGERRKDKRS